MIKKYQVRYADDSVLATITSTDDEAKYNAKYAHDSVIMSIEEVNPLFIDFLSSPKYNNLNF